MIHFLTGSYGGRRFRRENLDQHDLLYDLENGDALKIDKLRAYIDFRRDLSCGITLVTSEYMTVEFSHGQCRARATGVAMRSPNPMSLLEWLLLCVPIGAIAVWMWGWRTLAVMLMGAIVVGILFDLALQDPNPEDRVLAFFAQVGLMLIGAAGLVVAGIVALTIATPLAVLQW